MTPDRNQGPPLSEAKLAQPRLRGSTIPRPRLLDALDAGGEARLTLVSAPPGYGKTTVVRAWCETRPHVAWITLDAADDDPVRLWAYVAEAAERVRSGVGAPARRRLRVSGAPVDAAVDELLNALDAFGEELVLVLDDLQAVTHPNAVASLVHALGHLPANVRLVSTTRADPPFGLERLRANGELVELRAAELAFTLEETRLLVVEHGGIPLGADDVRLLHARTEGWPGALVLATLWLRGREDPDRAVRAFGGDHRFVADYLGHEVLSSLDDDLRGFVLRAAVLSSFTAELCDEVLERTDSAAVLAELERSNLFFVRLERGGWYRVHPLFAEYAAFELAGRDPAAAPAIHRRAAGSLRVRGRALEAVEHADRAVDQELLASILEEAHLPLIRGGAVQTIVERTKPLPDEVIARHPVLAVAAATAAMLAGGHTPERRRFLAIADRAVREFPEGTAPYVRAAAAMVRSSTVDGDVGRAVEQGRLAVELAGAHADQLVVAGLSAHAHALYLAGRAEDAAAAALRAIEHPDIEHRVPGHVFARSTLALAELDFGRTASARVHAERARAMVGSVGASSRGWLGANACAAIGSVLAAEGRLGEAERELTLAERFFTDEMATVQHAWVLLLLARVRLRRGRLGDAADALAAACDQSARAEDAGRIVALADEVERELGNARARAAASGPVEPPSRAELGVLELLASDLTMRQIGERLFLSPNTVRSHRRAIYRKLGVGTRADAVARADALGLLARDDSPG